MVKEKVSQTPMVAEILKFMDNPLYENYTECLRHEREAIIFEGKRTRDPHILSKLEGFDQAASFFQRVYDDVQKRNKQKIEEEHEPEY